MSSGIWDNFIFTTKHKAWVLWYIIKFCGALLRRGIIHDMSKYKRDEAESYERWVKATSGLVYGTPEYNRVRELFKDDDNLHYSRNSHHPGYYQKGIIEMSPLDLIEMLADWKAASRRNSGQDITKSIEINKAKFDFDDKMAASFVKDVTEAGLRD